MEIYPLNFTLKDNLNEKLRAAEDSEKQATDLEEESKLKLDEAEKNKVEAEEKLQQCLERESKTFEQLEKLKVRPWYLQFSVTISHIH